MGDPLMYPPTREAENELETIAKWPSGGTFWRVPKYLILLQEPPQDDQIRPNAARFYQTQQNTTKSSHI